MIRILTCSVSQIPPSEQLPELLPPAWRAAWELRHSACRREERLRESLGGLWLLSRLGFAGEILYGENGRPTAADETVDFSITHTDSAVFCALAEGEAGIRIGLDAELIGRCSAERMERLASRWLSPQERAYWKEDPTPERFASLWTRKEAAVKQSGEGLCALVGADVLASGELCFAEYRIADHAVALCYPSGERAPEEILVAEE